MGSEFEHLRERVLNGGHGGYLAFPEKVLPSEKIWFQYGQHNGFAPDHPVVPMLAGFWGFPLFTDSYLSKPARPAPPGWILHVFEGRSDQAGVVERDAA